MKRRLVRLWFGSSLGHGLRFVVDPTSEAHTPEGNLVAMRIYQIVQSLSIQLGVRIISEHGLLGDLDRRRVFCLEGDPAQIELLRTNTEDSRSEWTITLQPH